jgi:hypothetical protein
LECRVAGRERWRRKSDENKKKDERAGQSEKDVCATREERTARGNPGVLGGYYRIRNHSALTFFFFP